MTDIITLQEYKDAKSIGKNEQDDKLSLLISRVSALIEAYIGYTIVSSPTEQYVDNFHLDYCTEVIYLDKFPVTNIVSVTEMSPNQYDSTIHLPLSNISDFIFDVKNGRLIRKNGHWSQGYNAITVTYTGGYTTAPEPLKLACIDLVTYYIKEEYKVSRSAGGSSVHNPDSTVGSNEKFPGHIKRVLDLYRNL